MNTRTKTQSSRKALAAGIGAFLLALASGNLAHAQFNTGTGPNGTVVITNGTGALLNNTTGTSNTAYGFGALQANTTGSKNTAIGQNALLLNQAGIGNVAIGQSALQSNTASGNTALGNNALKLNTSGATNNAFGNNSLASNTSGSFNSAMGAQSLLANGSGASNSAFGFQALLKNTTGNFNVAIGDGALHNNTTGSGNIAIGEDGGFSLTVGSNNICIGNTGVAGESNIIRIGTAQTDAFIVGIIHGNGAGLTGVPASAVTGTLSGSQIGNGAISASKLGAASVTSAKLASDLTLGGTTTGTFTGSLTGNASTATSSQTIVAPTTLLHIASTGTFGQAAGFNFDGGSTGTLLESFEGGEGSGIFMNGNTMVLYSPGDSDILRVYDEDNLGDPNAIPAFTVLNGNAGIKTPGTGFFDSPDQSTERIRLAGQEFNVAGNTSTDGVSLLLGVNRDNNRQLWIGDSALLAINNTNPIIRIAPQPGGGGVSTIDAIATDGATSLPLKVGPVTLSTNGNITTAGLILLGSGTGTNENPSTPILVRRTTSQSTTDGQIVAIGDDLSLQRDGTNAGFKVVYTGGAGNRQTVTAMGINSAGGNVNKVLTIPAGTVIGTVFPVYSNADDVVHATIIFGDPFDVTGETEVTLQREPGDFFFHGIIKSTTNQ